MIILVAALGAVAAFLSYHEGIKRERGRVIGIVDTYISQATRDQEEMIVLAARAIRRRVEDPVTFR